MFYVQEVLSKKGPLGRVWIAAHMERKLTKQQVTQTNIPESAELIKQPKEDLALRLTGHLLLGLSRIYSRKVGYLLLDCTDALVKIKMAFRPGVVDMPATATTANIAAITIPEVTEDVLMDGDAMFVPTLADSHTMTTIADLSSITLPSPSQSQLHLLPPTQTPPLTPQQQTLDDDLLLHQKVHVTTPLSSTSSSSATASQQQRRRMGMMEGQQFGVGVVTPPVLARAGEGSVDLTLLPSQLQPESPMLLPQLSPWDVPLPHDLPTIDLPPPPSPELNRQHTPRKSGVMDIDLPPLTGLDDDLVLPDFPLPPLPTSSPKSSTINLSTPPTPALVTASPTLSAVPPPIPSPTLSQQQKLNAQEQAYEQQQQRQRELQQQQTDMEIDVDIAVETTDEPKPRARAQRVKQQQQQPAQQTRRTGKMVGVGVDAPGHTELSSDTMRRQVAAADDLVLPREFAPTTFTELFQQRRAQAYGEDELLFVSPFTNGLGLDIETGIASRLRLNTQEVMNADKVRVLGQVDEPVDAVEVMRATSTPTPHDTSLLEAPILGAPTTTRRGSRKSTPPTTPTSPLPPGAPSPTAATPGVQVPPVVEEEPELPLMGEDVVVPPLPSPELPVVEVGDVIVPQDDVPPFDPDQDNVQVPAEQDTQQTTQSQTVDLKHGSWSNRTRKMLRYVSKAMAGQDSLMFQTMCENRNRKQVSSAFFETLVLASRGIVDVEQTDPFGDITLKRTEKLDNVDDIPSSPGSIASTSQSTPLSLLTLSAPTDRSSPVEERPARKRRRTAAPSPSTSSSSQMSTSTSRSISLAA